MEKTKQQKIYEKQNAKQKLNVLTKKKDFIVKLGVI